MRSTGTARRSAAVAPATTRKVRSGRRERRLPRLRHKTDGEVAHQNDRGEQDGRESDLGRDEELRCDEHSEHDGAPQGAVRPLAVRQERRRRGGLLVKESKDQRRYRNEHQKQVRRAVLEDERGTGVEDRTNQRRET
jgi:hypothetical protein